jgi:hypothetical protein
MDRNVPQTRSTDPQHRRRARLLVLLILVFGLVALWTIRPSAVRAAVHHMESMLGGKSDASHVAPVPPRQPSKSHSGV